MSEAVLEGLGLRSLLQEEPLGLMARVRRLWAAIKAALRLGHTVKVIHDRVLRDGLKITYAVFSVYVWRLRREDAKSPIAPPAAVARTPLAKTTTPPLERDPLRPLDADRPAGGINHVANPNDFERIKGRKLI